MPTIHLNGRITETGELDLELPAGLPPGEARITIEIPAEPSWSAAELDRALQVVPLTGAEIVRGGSPEAGPTGGSPMARNGCGRGGGELARGL